MKCRLLRDEQITHPDLKNFEDFKAIAAEFHSGEISRDEYLEKTRCDVKAGTIIDHPQAFWLVAMGRAEPVDAECTRAAAARMAGRNGSFDADLIAAAEAADRLDAAQVTGDPQLDATDAQVEAMKAERAERKAAEAS